MAWLLYDRAMTQDRSARRAHLHAYHSTARPWLPLSFRDVVVAAGAQNVGA